MALPPGVTIDRTLAATGVAGPVDPALIATGVTGPVDPALAATGVAGPVDPALAATAASGDGMSIAEPASAKLERGAIVGRYVVLSRLGQGGMGVVFAAYDPELDRKVALKLLLPRLIRDADTGTVTAARTRLLREAQALAQLNHPNIVAVHDVGEHRGAVWLAMEYVEGETLSAYLAARRRTWREVLAVMTPAAVGLAAAHDAGLVHRDIKPDNIMVGADGRVRVMDLGLARALGDDDRPVGKLPPDAPPAATGNRQVLSVRVTQAGAIMGTPAYMSPEQFEGRPVDARTDVFSFCVTLWEALMGERPFAGDTLQELAVMVLTGVVRPVPRDAHARRVPGWLRRVCLQGLAVEPGRRFASMQALLGALSRGRTRARARRWLLGAAAVATLGASTVAYQRHDRAGRVAACEQVGLRIFDDWDAEARARVRGSIVATGLAYADVTADRVMPFLDAHAEAWRDSRTEVCLQADVERTLDAEQLDRAVWCLDERRMELAALVGELEHADPKIVQKAVTAAAGLPPASPCTDRQVLAALPPPPPVEQREKVDAVRTTLSRTFALLQAGRYPEGLDLVRAALAEAKALDWPPLTAAVREREGHLLDKTGAFVAGEAANQEAYLEAAKARAWNVAASAATELVFNVGDRQARHAEGKLWAGHAEVAIGLAGDPLGLREATRLNNLAVVHFRAGEYAEAKTLHEQALRIREETLGPDHPDVAFSLGNLAAVHSNTGARAEAKALLERALAIREKALGPDHPNVASSLNGLASLHNDAGEYAEAKALAERSLAIREKALGPDHLDVATSLVNIAIVQASTGAIAEAKASQRRVLDIQEKALGPEHPDVARTLNNLAETHGRAGEYTEAKTLYERALGIREKALGPRHVDVAYTLGSLGELALEQGRPAEALPFLERAVAIHDAIEGVQDGESEFRFSFAEALIGSGGDRTRALAEARRAATEFREHGAGRTTELARVEEFLAKHGDVPPSPPPKE